MDLKPRRRRTFDPSVYTVVSSPVKTVIIVEMEPILGKERLRCQEAAQRFETAKRELDHFRERLEPAFSSWFHSHFGEQATELRTLESRLRELEYVVFSVETEAQASGCSLRTAYERIEHAKLEMARLEREREKASKAQQPEFDWSGKNPQSTEDLTHEISPEIEEMLRANFEEIFGREPEDSGEKARYAALFEEFKQSFREDVLGEEKLGRPGAEDFGEADEDFDTPALPRKSAAADPDESRRKQIYRTLARRLHPDVNSTFTPQQKNLWNEVQLAYDNRDLNRLEMLLAISDSGDLEANESGFESVRSLSRLKSIYSDFSKKFRSIQKEMRELKKGAVWEFFTAGRDKSKLTDLSRRIALELETESDEMRYGISRLQKAIDQWAHPVRGRAKGKPSRSSRSTR